MTNATTRVPQLELECLKVLWQRPGATVADVRAALPRPLAYTTVMTVLDRMSAKGIASRRKNGRAYAYSAVLAAETARAHAVRQLLANHFSQDPQALLRYLSGGPVEASSPAAPRRAPAEKPRKPARRVPSPHIDESLL